jgi:glycosyltransferase involved in cell wall biosynthesis
MRIATTAPWVDEFRTTALDRSESQLPGSVVLVGTYPPTACGLATFTANLRAAIAAPGSGWRADVIRLVDRPEEDLDEPVVEQWVAGDPWSLTRVLDTAKAYDALLLQHEYGLFGGADGDEVLHLIDGLKAPLVAVLHTVLLDPSLNQRSILERVVDAAEVVVVQSHAARHRLVEVHRTEPHRVVVIPHGAAANFSGPPVVGLPKPMVLTWGLLGPGKGVEHAVRAVAALGDRHPPATYVVAGQTHPKVRAASGEWYRQGLIALAEDLGVSDRVRFDDAYRDWESLRALVRSADAVLLPYDSTDQVSSGVLVEALASGKPVVATGFPHAAELLAGGAGMIVPHGDSEAMAAALARVLYEPGVAEAMASAARREAQALLWPAVGAAYRALIGEVVGTRKAG